MRNCNTSRKTELMKRLTYQPAVAALALILASCASSPIKHLVCNSEQGKDHTDQILFDPEKKIVYEYDEFTEMLKPITKPESFDVFDYVFTDSGRLKIKIGRINKNYFSWTIVNSIDLSTLSFTQETTNITHWDGPDKTEIEKSSGTCKYVTPKITKVFEG